MLEFVRAIPMFWNNQPIIAKNTDKRSEQAASVNVEPKAFQRQFRPMWDTYTILNCKYFILVSKGYYQQLSLFNGEVYRYAQPSICEEYEDITQNALFTQRNPVGAMSKGNAAQQLRKTQYRYECLAMVPKLLIFSVAFQGLAQLVRWPFRPDRYVYAPLSHWKLQ